MDIGTTHTWAALLPSTTIGLVGGILNLFWPELVRSFVARHRPEIAQRFVDEDAHRRFIEFCGVVMLLIVVCVSVGSVRRTLTSCVSVGWRLSIGRAA